MASDAAERQKAAGREGGKLGGRGKRNPEGSKIPKGSSTKTVAKAAAAAKAGEKQVQTMVAVKKSAPEVFAAVQQGEVKTVAEWMAEQFNSKGKLVQRKVAVEIEKRFGAQFLYRNKNNNRAIKRPILTAFRELTPDAVWNRWDQTWHLRQAGQAGRTDD